MAGFMLALVAVFLTSLGARDQLLVAALSQKLDRHLGLLVTGCITAVITSIVMALAGDYVASLIPENARNMLVAIALALASIELFWPMRAHQIAEPTRSLGAIGLVLLARQWSDASRFLVFAFAAWSGSIGLAAAGGALGGAAAIGLGWMMAGELKRRIPLRLIRFLLGAGTICLAAYIALSTRGLL